MRSLRFLVGSISLLVVAGLDAQAQCTAAGAPANCSQAGSVSMTAGRVVRLQMSAGSTSLTAPTTADFDAGFNSTTGPTLTVSANAAWTLHIRAASAVWTATNTTTGVVARVNKPAADLKWSTASNGTFTALSASDANLVSGPATASSATTLYFQTLYDWALDTPGNYSMSVVLTLTSP
ncbi:MAG TPA: hypothetical protein VFP26_00010 [Gemmatimonadaceae bacterium]|jgi:hypothetical protein|nr:hypothetical protein [Gemmatimonadaceae bacterium]